MGKSWGVVATDIDNDGWMDLFIANDTERKFSVARTAIRRNRHGGWRRLQRGRTAGSGMGVDSADYDQDGRQDLFVNNIDHEMYSLYRNRGDQTFDDEAERMGIDKLMA